jgi:hypothetical protein
MIKGLALTPPVVGRIAIGKVVEKGGKRLPEKDDEFTLTSQVQARDGWINHPLDEALRKEAGAKLRVIPIRLLFDDVDLNLRASYTLFDRTNGRPVCVGNGETCKRATPSGFGHELPHAPWLRVRARGLQALRPLNVRIGDEDELGASCFRPRGSAHPHPGGAADVLLGLSGAAVVFAAGSSATGKSTTQSHRAPIYYGSHGTDRDDAGGSGRESPDGSGVGQRGLTRRRSTWLRGRHANGAFEELEEDGTWWLRVLPKSVPMRTPGRWAPSRTCSITRFMTGSTRVSRARSKCSR